MPNAEASLPSARERRLSFATPAMESTIASRNCRSLSFCPRTNGSSFRCRLFLVARISCFALLAAKFFRAPLARGDLPKRTATFFGALAAGFLAGRLFFLAGFDDVARAFVTFGRDDFFAGFLDFAGALELFFFAELAIFGRRPWF